MLIAIDGNEANIDKRVGSNIYAHQILTGLSLDSKANYQVHLKSAPLPDLPKQSSNWQYQVYGPKPAWTRWRLPLQLYTQNPKPDLFFTPGHYAPQFSPMPKVISIMDLAYLYYPETFTPKVLRQLKNWTSESVKKATHIFTISENTKRDVVKTFKVAPHTVTVTYPGSNLKSTKKSSQTQITKTLKKYGMPDKYFIFVGTNQPRKNLKRLSEAFIPISQKHPDTHLIIVGKTWHQFQTEKPVAHPYIHHLNYLPQKDLVDLISGSLALVFPSLYEGFGLPVLEAMELGVLVAAADNSSIPEITGDSPLLFDPLFPKEITASLEQVLILKPEAKQKLIKVAKIRARRFTWKNCVNQTKEVLHELAIQR